MNPPSWRKLVRRLRGQSEADGEGQAGEPGDGYWLSKEECEEDEVTVEVEDE